MTSLEIIILVFAGLIIALGAAMLLRPHQLSKILMEMMDEPSEIFSLGVMTLILGLVVLGITGYSVTWESTLWIAPLLGWIATIKGALLILMPDVVKPIAKPLYKANGMMMFAGFIALVIGVWLFYLL
ncbi:MAG: hypothetical protein WC553_00185 [Patescibacteria group bacterium]|jgi:uncharacterized protein YjeT (DUF2065 family)